MASNELTDAQLTALLQRWADGKATLKDVRGYEEEELYAIAKAAYFFYYQGNLREARTLFQGLYAINPLDSYFAKALGVVELASGNSAGALQAYDVAIKLDPADAAAFVGRAEVRLEQGQRGPAVDDLRKAADLTGDNKRLAAKVSAMLDGLKRRA